VSTPGGQILLLECTLKISDFSTKVGKLVDRRGSLQRFLEEAGRRSQILAVLVCRLPRAQIAAHNEELHSRKVVLLANEDLSAGLDRVRNPEDPDKVVEQIRSSLESAKVDLFGLNERSGLQRATSLM
jgi:hypothetical protein